MADCNVDVSENTTNAHLKALASRLLCLSDIIELWLWCLRPASVAASKIWSCMRLEAACTDRSHIKLKPFTWAVTLSMFCPVERFIQVAHQCLLLLKMHSMRIVAILLLLDPA